MASSPQLGLLIVEEDASKMSVVAAAAESAGLASVWTIEYYNRNSLVRLALLAAATKTITIGSAVTAAFARSPLMIATAVADIHAVCPGRLILGLGTSTKRMNDDWYGVDASHPAPRLEELVRLLRELWAHAGGPFSFEGRFNNLRFAHLDKEALSHDVPIYTAGVNERMVSSAGAAGDGFIGHPLATTTYLTQVAKPAIERGRDIAGRQGFPKIATQVIAAVDDREAAARRRAAMQVAFYATVKTYDIIFELHGWQEERDAVRVAFASGDRAGMLRAVSDRMLNEVAVFGSASTVAEQLRRYEGVVDTVLLYPPHFDVTAEERWLGHEGIVELARVSPRGETYAGFQTTSDGGVAV